MGSNGEFLAEVSSNDPTSPGGIVRKAREDNKKKEIIERIRKKAKKAAEKLGDDIADEMLDKLDDITVEELEDLEEAADEYLNGTILKGKQIKFDFELDDGPEEDDY